MVNWLPVPIKEEPPASDRSRPSVPLVKRVELLVEHPGVWFQLGNGMNAATYSERIRDAYALPGEWESVVRNGLLYARFVGVGE